MKRILYIFMLFFSGISLNAQHLGIKTNVLYDLTTTINLGPEIGLGKRFSLDIPVNYNPWEFSDNRKIKHWMVQPELRYWFCERFNRHFIGLHGIAGQYNFCNIDISDNLRDYNYQGDFYGVGLAYGYQWILGNRWGFEASIGAGYVYLDYDKYQCAECGTLIKSDTKHYFGITKLSLSFVYFIF
ncbi:MAG: DUF3575 domain-containing protein [Bacteroidales bacterium]|nr:DUF3575 domain-containing protein [Bacteroidales bacterium]